MEKRVLTGIVVTIVMLLVLVPALHWPLWTLIFMSLIAVMMTLELHQAMQRVFRPLSLELMVGSSLVFLAPCVAWLKYAKQFKSWQFIPTALLPPSNFSKDWKLDSFRLIASGVFYVALVSMLMIFISLIYTVLRYGPARIPQCVAAFSSIFYIGAPLSCVTLLLYAVPNGYRWLFPAVFVPWISDVAAYYGGKFLGKRPFFKSISPNKTLEGALIGLAAGGLLTMFYFMIFLSGSFEPFHKLPFAAVFGFFGGVFLSAAGEAGDLFASALKRWAGIKDFSKALPGHGGVLDRFDSVLFAMPLSFILMMLYYAY